MSFLKKIFQNGNILFWLIPISIIVGIIFLFYGIKNKISKNQVGKPEILIARTYGKIENISVKTGDEVEPGKVLLRYTITDEYGKKGKKRDKIRKMQVTTKRIKTEIFYERIELPGLIRPVINSNIFAQASGKIIKIHVEKGQKVKKGDILASIEKNDYKISLANKKATFDLAKLDLKRTRKLAKEKTLSTADLDKAQAQYRAAQADYDNAVLALYRCDIRAPFSGIINNRFKEIGEFADFGEKVCNLIDISTVKVSIGIPEQDINFVKNVKKVKFIVPALENMEFEGDINNVAFSSSDYAHVYPIEVYVKNPEELLLPGMIVKSDVIKKIHKKAVLLPIFSVIPGDNGEYYTFVEINGKAKKKFVKLGK